MLQDPGTRNLIDSADDFQRRVLEELTKHVRCCEKEAAETGLTVMGDFIVGDDEGDEPILRIRFICEPGKEVRVISVDGQRDNSTGDDWPPATLH
jgi:hypothetical protein